MELVLRPERLVAGGAALARGDDGRVVFVTGALPGDEVRVEVTEAKRDYARASVLEVLQPSPDRVEPSCPNVHRGCGGCDWQHLAVEAQRRARLGIVVEALSRTGGLRDAVVRPGPALPEGGCRTTLRLAVDDEGRPGLRGRRSDRVVPLTDCAVAHPLISSLLPDLRVVGGTEVVLRCGAATGERAAWWDPPSASAEGLPADVALGRAGIVHEVVGGRRLRVSPGSFFQSSRVGAQALVDAVTDAADGVLDGTTIIDAFGGIGLFAATVAAGARQVVVVESSDSSCQDARHNLAGRAASVVSSRVDRWSCEPADLVIADPPRAGLGRDAATVLASTGAQRLVLVSCDPVSLARDAKLLAGLGLRHVESTVLDLFPQTSHVEVVTRFDRGSSERPSAP